MKRHGLLRLLPLAAALTAAGGCVSSSDIEGLSTQISDVQRQVLQMQMQTSSKEEVASLEQTLENRMERVIQSEADMQVRLGELSSQIEQLQAKLEDTNYRLAQVSQQIAATNQELRAFRTQAEATAARPGTESEPAPNRPGPIDPEALYQQAYDDYLRGNYDLAIASFEEYLENFPNTDLADNATYWIGESYYRQEKFRQAIDQFERVLRRYPRSEKAPGALLKKGYAYLELGERSQGIVQLQYVIREHPSSDEAEIARDRLRALGVDINR
ncbi:MAG TPA: tol-pal system protein YbgF [Thermoanaerobaculia bacterium]|nr:tol-pal system protein YbgF [Thermoanaerobaculia bacterium]